MCSCGVGHYLCFPAVCPVYLGQDYGVACDMQRGCREVKCMTNGFDVNKCGRDFEYYSPVRAGGVLGVLQLHKGCGVLM